MLAQERRDLDVLFLGRLGRCPAMRIERSLGAFGGRRRVRNPWRACLYCAPGRCVVSRRIAGFIAMVVVGRSQVDPDVGRQTLEQRARVARLGVLFFLSAE